MVLPLGRVVVRDVLEGGTSTTGVAASAGQSAYKSAALAARSRGVMRTVMRSAVRTSQFSARRVEYKTVSR